MKKQIMHASNLVQFLRYLSIPGVILILILGYVVVPITPAVRAASGDFIIDFAAAAPYTYNHLIGGGSYDNKAIGVDKDIVRSLQGGDFVCSDIVTFFATVTVDNTQTAIDDGPQTIEMDFSFLMDTTGQSGVAIGDIVDVFVNYGPIDRWDVDGDGTPDVIGDGEQDGVPNDTDAGIIDDSGSVATLIDEWTTGDIFTAGSELWGTVELTDLHAGEQVVVRIDVRLYCNPEITPTGNLQAALEGARLTFINDTTPVDPPEDIPGGAQTIPFQDIAEVIFLDFGDLPAAYGLTNFDVDGARHGIGELFLGNTVDSDSDGQESAQADYDDMMDQGDDEDGIVRPTGSNWSDGQGEVLATLSEPGCLTAWLDYINGSNFGYNYYFTDTITVDNTVFDELVIENQLLPAGTNQVDFDLPLGAANDNALFYARFRLVPTLLGGECGEAPSLTGYVLGGEVEDYALLFGPTAVTLAEFEASSKSGVPSIKMVVVVLAGLILLGLIFMSVLRLKPKAHNP